MDSAIYGYFHKSILPLHYFPLSMISRFQTLPPLLSLPPSIILIDKPPLFCSLFNIQTFYINYWCLLSNPLFPSLSLSPLPLFSLSLFSTCVNRPPLPFLFISTPHYHIPIFSNFRSLISIFNSLVPFINPPIQRILGSSPFCDPKILFFKKE